MRARDGKLIVDDMQGGTFTISNGGVYGSLMSTPILNAPQSGILGMHKIQERPVVVGGQIVIRPMMYLALSYDHRIVDGKEAVTFLVRVKESLEDPAAAGAGSVTPPSTTRRHCGVVGPWQIGPTVDKVLDDWHVEGVLSGSTDVECALAGASSVAVAGPCAAALAASDLGPTYLFSPRDEPPRIPQVCIAGRLARALNNLLATYPSLCRAWPWG